jgi:hypothetical protein
MDKILYYVIAVFLIIAAVVFSAVAIKAIINFIVFIAAAVIMN